MCASELTASKPVVSGRLQHKNHRTSTTGSTPGGQGDRAAAQLRRLPAFGRDTDAPVLDRPNHPPCRTEAASAQPCAAGDRIALRAAGARAGLVAWPCNDGVAHAAATPSTVCRGAEAYSIGTPEPHRARARMVPRASVAPQTAPTTD